MSSGTSWQLFSSKYLSNFLLGAGGHASCLRVPGILIARDRNISCWQRLIINPSPCLLEYFSTTEIHFKVFLGGLPRNVWPAIFTGEVFNYFQFWREIKKKYGGQSFNLYPDKFISIPRDRAISISIKYKSSVWLRGKCYAPPLEKRIMNNSKRNLELDNFIAEWTLIFIRVNNTGTKLFPMGQIFKYSRK